MKFFLLLCTGVFLLMSGTSNINEVQKSKKGKNIDLRGELSAIKPRSLDPYSSENSVYAMLEESAILISFSAPLEDITINVFDAHHNSVYNMQVYIASPQEVQIPLNNLPQGLYFIEFISPYYGYLIGNFTL